MALLSCGDLVLDTTDKTVSRNSRPIEISKIPLAVLCYFIQHAADGRVVTRDELRTQIWGRRIEDVTIRSSLSILRGALGDPATHPRYVQTLGKEGWRLLLPVSRLPAQPRCLLPAPPGGTYDPFHYIPRPGEEQVLLTVPKLIFHGEADDLIPVSMGRELYESAAEPKRFVSYPKAGHNDWPGQYWRQWREEIAQFIRTVGR